MTKNTIEVNDGDLSGGTRLEKLEALGFVDEHDYAEHQRVMQASKDLGNKQLAGVVYRSEVEVDKESLLSIERRAATLKKGMETETAELIALADVSDFKRISSVHYQRFAAVEIFDNLVASHEYKLAFVNVAVKYPGLVGEIIELNDANTALIWEKEDRKATEFVAADGDAVLGRIERTQAEGTRREQGITALVDTPYLMTRAEFVSIATASPLVNHGRRWEVFAEGKNYGFSDAATKEDAVLDVHRREVNNALWGNSKDAPWSHDPEFKGMGDKPVMPPAHVLAEYPDLQVKFSELLGAHDGVKPIKKAGKPGYPSPDEIVQIYAEREAQVSVLSLQQSISTDDLKALTRHGRIQVADELWNKCDGAAQEALLTDQHAHVRSTAIVRRDRPAPVADIKPIYLSSAEYFAQYPGAPTWRTPAVTAGMYSGPVMVIDGDFLIGQKAGRDPAVLTWHDRGNLRGPDLKVWDKVEIGYVGGVGAVKVLGVEVEGAGQGR